MKFFILFLLFEFAFGQNVVLPDPEQYKIKPRCPQNLERNTVKALIESRIKAEELGHLRPQVAKKSCLDQKTPYRVVVPDQEFHDNSPRPELFFITSYKINSFSKFSSSRFSDNYMVSVKLEGSDRSGRPVSVTQDALFAIKKGSEAEMYGCVDIYYGWQRPFIKQDCLK